MSAPNADQDDMSPSQRKAIQQAYELLGEHFNASIIAVTFEVEGEDGRRVNSQEYLWNGGSMNAIGLATMLRHRLTHGPGEVAP